MSFPVCPSNRGTLCDNIAKSLQSLPPHKRPPLHDVFTRIDHLFQLCALYPGTVQEIGQCALLLKERHLFTDDDKNRQKKLIGHSLLAQKADGDIAKKSKQTFNLSQALDTQRRSLPQLVDLANAVLDLIKITHLKLQYFPNLNKCLVDLYPVEERSAQDRIAWDQFKMSIETGFCADQSRCSDALISKFQALQVSYIQAEKWQKAVRAVRQSGQTAPENILKAISQTAAYRAAKGFELLKILQTLLNGLLAEERIGSKFCDLCDQLSNFYPKNRDHLSFKERAQECDFAMSHGIDEFVKRQEPHHRKKFLDLFHNWSGQLEKIHLSMPAVNNQFSARESEARLIYSLDKMSKLRVKAQTAPPLDGICPNSWRAFSALIVKHTDYLILANQVRHQMHCLAINGRDLFQLKALDAQLANVALPALALINRAYITDYLRAFKEWNKNHWEYIAEMKSIAELIKATDSIRVQIYRALHKQLKDQLPPKGQARRQALHFTAIFIDEIDRDLPLPESLLSEQKTRSQNIDVNAHQGNALSPLIKGELKGSDIVSMAAESSIMPWSRLKIELQNWRSPLIYHPRVSRWFSAHHPLARGDFPEYSQRSPSYQNLMICLHRLIPLADFFCQRGWTQSSLSDRGQLIKRLILPADLELDGKLQRGLIVWAIDAHNICYHRFFHKEVKSVDIVEPLRASFEQTQSIPEIAGDESLGTLEFNDCGDQSAKIDQLTKTATLKDEKVPGLLLYLKFMD